MDGDGNGVGDGYGYGHGDGINVGLRFYYLHTAFMAPFSDENLPPPV